jgi:hypothetical protein
MAVFNQEMKMSTDFSKFRREVANRQYEISDSGGIYLPKAKVMLGGVFEVDHIRDGKSLGITRDHNIVVNEGLNHILSAVFNAGTQITAWYVGIFEGNYTPVATDTAANITANSTECTAYDEATRVAWVEAAPSGQSITNSASKATFTMNATKTIYGAFLASASAKSATTGTLMAASKFSASRAVVNLDQLLLTYALSCSDA